MFTARNKRRRSTGKTTSAIAGKAAGKAYDGALVARPPMDWPTLALAVGIYGLFGLVTWYYAALPWWLVLTLGATLVCLQSSLQHEAIHGYPTRWGWVNYLVAAPALWLWLPYGLNQKGHLKHHVDENLTDPTEDPESNYLTPEAWERMSDPHRLIRQAMTTLIGRIVIGPIYYAVKAAHQLALGLVRGDRDVILHWSLHGVALAAMLGWVIGVCHISLLEYVVLFAWPGTGLALIRSFAEHRASPDVAARSAVVESGPVMSFLYLYNNLHALHHAEPALAWHQRPARYHALRAETLRGNRYNYVSSYASLFRNNLLEARQPLLHPAFGKGLDVAKSSKRIVEPHPDQAIGTAA